MRSRVFSVIVLAEQTEASILSDDALLVMLDELKARGSESKVPVVEREAVETSFTQGIETFVAQVLGYVLIVRPFTPILAGRALDRSPNT